MVHQISSVSLLSYLSVKKSLALDSIKPTSFLLYLLWFLSLVYEAPPTFQPQICCPASFYSALQLYVFQLLFNPHGLLLCVRREVGIQYTLGVWASVGPQPVFQRAPDTFCSALRAVEWERPSFRLKSYYNFKKNVCLYSMITLISVRKEIMCLVLIR